ncbi:MAG: carbohydrate kinase family protein [Kiritimatiellae bacterium]|nr:carbohydrate kinase family protein [Kiritimatiellia bacterium]
MNRIVFCGSMIADVIKTLPTWPDKGMLVPITAIRRQIGGAVCNSGVDLKTLDPSVEVRAVGAVGADDNGDFVVEYLSSRGLDCSQVRRVKGVPTSFTDVMTVEPTGERTFFNMHGADSTLVPEDIDVSRFDCDIFHFGYLLLLDGMDAPDPEYGTKAARLLAAVQAAGIRTSIDIVSEQSDRFARIVSPALRYCDYCIVNEIEGSMATGAPSDDLRAICEGLLAAGVREQAVVHCPDAGASLDRNGNFARVGSLRLPQGWIKGSVGAGDAFCAGVLYAIMKGMDADQALRLGSCTAAMNLSVTDSVSGAKSYAETIALDSKFARRD